MQVVDLDFVGHHAVQKLFVVQTGSVGLMVTVTSKLLAMLSLGLRSKRTRCHHFLLSAARVLSCVHVSEGSVSMRRSPVTLHFVLVERCV